MPTFKSKLQKEIKRLKAENMEMKTTLKKIYHGRQSLNIYENISRMNYFGNDIQLGIHNNSCTMEINTDLQTYEIIKKYAEMEVGSSEEVEKEEVKDNKKKYDFIENE